MGVTATALAAIILATDRFINDAIT